MSSSRTWETAEARDDDTIVGVSGAEGYVASGRTNDWNIVLVVGRRVEICGVAPSRLIGGQSRDANAIVEVQLWRYRPRVLNKPLIHLACPTCVCPRSDFRVAVC